VKTKKIQGLNVGDGDVWLQADWPIAVSFSCFFYCRMPSIMSVDAL